MISQYTAGIGIPIGTSFNENWSAPSEAMR
jgi:hypothetical protein